MPKLGQRRDPVDRFIEKIEFTEGCWLWTGHRNHEGYARFQLDRKTKIYAHRYAWETFVGPIPEGLELDHVRAAGCTSTACVNPDHLEPVTHLENIRRGRHATKTHCVHGHEFTPENIRITEQGARRCRQCEKAKYQARLTGIPAPASYNRVVPRKTHCKRGHQLSGDNLLVSKGTRYCRACLYARNKRQREARNASAA